MGDLTKLAKAARELEELYYGVPDESVNLTFQDLVELNQNKVTEQKKYHNVEPIQEVAERKEIAPSKSSKHEIKKGLQASRGLHDHHVERKGKDAPPHEGGEGMQASKNHHHVDGDIYRDHASPNNSKRSTTGFRNTTESNSQAYALGYDGISSKRQASRSPYLERGGRRRPGIPHSNICTICSVYIYIFRHRRCFVCGRVYCRHCVSMGMGEMTEGRKCIECLGRRFSQRYIGRAGEIGCCSRYPSRVKLQELKWAEKGPRRSGDRGRGYSQSGMMSRSRSPVVPRTPTRAPAGSSTPSFVMNSPYSAYSPTNHPIPF